MGVLNEKRCKIMKAHYKWFFAVLTNEYIVHRYGIIVLYIIIL